MQGVVGLQRWCVPLLHTSVCAVQVQVRSSFAVTAQKLVRLQHQPVVQYDRCTLSQCCQKNVARGYFQDTCRGGA
jgi:hypothetical protein